MTLKTYQLYIELQGIEPKIWRRILVSENTLLVDFHRILQTCFGWTNSHLHLFKDGMYEYSPAEFEVENTHDSRTLRLNNILHLDGQIIYYLYDFSDSWEHKVILEKIITETMSEQVPQCKEGARCGPPEDCGSIEGYYENLKITADKKHEEYKSTKIRLGQRYDPEEFKIDTINKLLKRRDYGCEWIQ